MEIKQSRVVLRARSFASTCRFYGEVLALPRLTSWDGSEGRGACFQAGMMVVEIQARPPGGFGDPRDDAFDQPVAHQPVNLGFVVPSAEAVYRELRQRDKNIPGGLRRTADGSITFETRDPDGVRIVYHQAD